MFQDGSTSCVSVCCPFSLLSCTPFYEYMTAVLRKDRQNSPFEGCLGPFTALTVVRKGPVRSVLVQVVLWTSVCMSLG